MERFNKSPNKEIEFGITTGTAAAAASLAAFLAIKNKTISFVDIKTPVGILKIDVANSKCLDEKSGQACILKKSYNDPDVTKNMKICAQVKIIDQPQIIIKGGKGVGTITKPGLQVPVGEAAINPTPQSIIEENLKLFLEKNQGLEVIISAPNGEEIAKKTMNPRLGIIGGISILGTTGIARPMSSKAYMESLTCQIDVALAQGYDQLIFVPGNIGQELALKILTKEEDQIVQMSNFVGYMLKEAAHKGVKNIILMGHAGKLVKIAAGIFNTKNSIADGRAEIIAAYAGLVGAPQDIIKKVFESKTTEDMIEILNEKDLVKEVFNSIAESIKYKCEKRFSINFEVIIVRMDGTILNSI
ncbi:MAG: cobalt-precorrin-5B (C(1))-methyltransferase CbiD [Methanobacteriaceae archaeon]|jgi:cobalt-precorrin-5B (C1)-methyltransferase|nr:cobalt-precorrin-5B (C(1))-methyltransferase CbiD [Methanobacteriaceae archaeon]